MHILLVIAMPRTDYTTMLVINSASLLSAVLVGAYRSGVKDIPPGIEGEGGNGATTAPPTKSDKIGSQQVWICLVVFIGIVIFNLSQPAHSEENRGCREE